MLIVVQQSIKGGWIARYCDGMASDHGDTVEEALAKFCGHAKIDRSQLVPAGERDEPTKQF